MTFGAYIFETWCDAEFAKKCWTVYRIRGSSKNDCVRQASERGWVFRGQNRNMKSSYCPECLKQIVFTGNHKVLRKLTRPRREPSYLPPSYRVPGDIHA